MKRPTKTRPRPAIALVAVPVLLLICASLPSCAASAPQGTAAAVSARVQAHGSGRVVLALLSEENLPPQEMASPTPGAAASPAASPGARPVAAPPPPASGKDASGWTRLPAGSATPESARPSTAGEGVKAAGGGAPPAGTAVPPGWASNEAAPGPTPGTGGPTATSPPYDIGSVQPTPPVSDQPLTALIEAAEGQPALSASLRFAERARKLLEKSKPDEAIRTLARAVSIDPSNPYAYFYLGRAYMMKKNCQQALAFFGRAEVGLRAVPAWFGEVKSYEGACFEEQGKFAKAANDYKQALDVAPGNMMALAGYGRLSSDVNVGNEPPPYAPNADMAPPAPADSSLVTPPPSENPPKPAHPDGQAAPSDN